MFVLLTSISQYISEIILFSEYEILTGWLVNTKLLGFRLLWDMTVYVIDRQNCPTVERAWSVEGVDTVLAVRNRYLVAAPRPVTSLILLALLGSYEKSEAIAV